MSERKPTFLVNNNQSTQQPVMISSSKNEFEQANAKLLEDRAAQERVKKEELERQRLEELALQEATEPETPQVEEPMATPGVSVEPVVIPSPEAVDDMNSFFGISSQPIVEKEEEPSSLKEDHLDRVETETLLLNVEDPASDEEVHFETAEDSEVQGTVETTMTTSDTTNKVNPTSRFLPGTEFKESKSEVVEEEELEIVVLNSEKDSHDNEESDQLDIKVDSVVEEPKQDPNLIIKDPVNESDLKGDDVVVPFNSPDDIKDAYLKEVARLEATSKTQEEFTVKRFNSKEIYELGRSEQHYVPEQRRLTTDMKATAEAGQKLEYAWMDTDGKVHKNSRRIGKSVLNKLQDNAVISATSTSIIFAAITNGVKHTVFPNSGFWIRHRAPTNNELDVFVRNTYMSTFQHGKTTGQFFFIPADTDIQRELLEMSMSLINKCNLENWKIGDTFQRHFKSPDYSVLLHSIAHSLFPEGAMIKFTCEGNRQPDGTIVPCPVPVKPTIIDLSQIQFTSFTKMHDDAKKMLFSESTKTSAQLAEYQDKLGFNKTIDIGKFNGLQFKAEMQVPDKYTELEYAQRFNAGLASKIQLTDENDVARYLLLARNQFFAPWIKRLTIIEENGKKLNFDQRIVDEQGDSVINEELMQSLESLDVEPLDHMFMTSVRDYINTTNLSYFGYPYSQCPDCGAPVTSAVDGVIPCDIQTTFFQLAVRKLNSVVDQKANLQNIAIA